MKQEFFLYRWSDFRPQTDWGKAVVGLYGRICHDVFVWGRKDLDLYKEYLEKIQGDNLRVCEVKQYLRMLGEGDEEGVASFEYLRAIEDYYVWNYLKEWYEYANKPIAAVIYLMFSEDDKIIKIGSSENMISRRASYGKDKDFRAHGIGNIYCFECLSEERYFLEDVLRAEVGSKFEVWKTYKTDRFYYTGGDQCRFMRQHKKKLEDALGAARNFFAKHKNDPDIFEKWIFA